MREHRYQPGDGSWLTFASGTQLLAVDLAATADVESVWSAVSSGFQEVLDVLTARGLSATPSFALVAWTEDAGLRAIVRGPVRFTASSGRDEEVLDGTGVSTWTEKIFAADARFSLRIADGEGARMLPLVSGVVPTSLVESAAVDDSSTERPSVVVQSPEAPASPPAPAATPLPEATMQDVSDQEPSNLSDGEGQDEPLDATMHRNVPSMPSMPSMPSAPSGTGQQGDGNVPPAVAEEARVGDHDGMTIMTGELRRMRAERRAGATAAPAAPAAATLVLELSNGTVESLDQTLIVGRSPSASKVSGGAIPRLVTIPGDKDISRNHAQFAVEGGTVVVTDLHSRNGTKIIMPGRAPQQLRQGEPTAVIVGTVVDLGGGVLLTVREDE